MNKELNAFCEQVAVKFKLYNSLFLTLPFEQMAEVQRLLTEFAALCNKLVQAGKDPQTIIQQLLKQSAELDPSSTELNTLTAILQFIERQIVLFDALEDAAFADTHDLNGPGSWQHFAKKIVSQSDITNLIKQIQNYQIKIVLTAHPTQFYPKPILGIINKLIQATRSDNLHLISELLIQLGRTSLKQHEKPTPYEEAYSLVWYLDNIFYHAIPALQHQINKTLTQHSYKKKPLCNNIVLGFWPGGDRDGNPFVTEKTTLRVALLLKTRILAAYIRDLRKLVTQLTFTGVYEKLQAIKHKLKYTIITIHSQQKPEKHTIYKNYHELLKELERVRKTLIIKHQSLFIDRLDEYIQKIKCFGFHFASIDMRQDARVHQAVFLSVLKDLKIKNYQQWDNKHKLDLLEQLMTRPTPYTPTVKIKNQQISNTIKSLQVIPLIQQQNGEAGLMRYVISNTSSAWDVLELLTLLKLTTGFKKAISIDIIPLFESITDLEQATNIMEELWQTKFYRQHLNHRNNSQTIMLGFSDGTKDGGYVSANWSIHQAKWRLTTLAKQYKINVIFFDGRGGPPGRGGGNTHDFYRSLGNNIHHNKLQLTIQGQTISSHFGTPYSAQFNIEQLFTAGLEDLVFPEQANDLNQQQVALLDELSEHSLNAYQALKSHLLFVPYLEKMTPLKHYAELNIGSRPTSRKKSANLNLSDLRAIPFVGAWNQIKQNIPGFYGFGSGLQALIKAGKKAELIALYQQSLFFRTLVNNAMMSLLKSHFPLTAYLKKDSEFGEFWKILYKEARLSARLLKEISGQSELLANEPITRASIKLREQMIMPLLVIQQFSLDKIKLLNKKDKHYRHYKNLILKALAANTNASRNAA